MRIRDWSSDVCSSDLLQQVAHFPKRVLRLGHGHAVAGHDDDLFGLLHEKRRIFSRAALPRPVCGCSAAASAAAFSAEATGNDTDEATVHCPAHDVEKDSAQIGRSLCRESVGQYV